MPGRIDPSQIPSAPNLEFESSLWQQGQVCVAGLDEAGRGAWAGPVYAAAVVLPSENDKIEQELHGVRDSKQLTPLERESLAPVIIAHALTSAVGASSAAEIDQFGILFATRLAMQRALNALTPPPDELLIDALFLPDISCAQTSLIKGDQRSLSIAAASILAKTSRDACMLEYDALYPGYGFARHKGYGTALHQQRLAQLGACPIHRRSFAPLRGMD